MELALTMSFRTLSLKLWLSLAPLAPLAACGSPGAPLPDDVKDPARRAYYEGMRELVDRDYVKATTLFQTVAASPRHVKHAALAKLRLGDALFFQGRYAEATEVYRSFVQQHNADPNLPYARFKTAECYYERLPSEWFASPPAEEFDQTITTQAEAELKGFVTMFPTSVYAPRARKMLAQTRQLLFRTEMYAVDFYSQREKWQAVAWRLRDALDTYPELALGDAFVWRLANAWDKVGDRVETAKALGLYLSKFPEGAHADAAKAKLEAVKKALDEEANKPPTPPPGPPEKPVAPAPDPDGQPPEEAPPEEPGGSDDDLKLEPPTLPPAPE